MKLLPVKRSDVLHWLPRLVVAFIIGQTLPIKFMGTPESIWIFEALNMEPWGRYSIASIELISVIALLSRYYVIGAIISISVISAANFYHFTVLGIEVAGDGGTLFTLSVVVFLASLWLIFYWNVLHKKQRVIMDIPKEVQLQDFD